MIKSESARILAVRVHTRLGDQGVVMYVEGAWAQSERDMCGDRLEDWLLVPPSHPGVWVWIGKILFHHTCMDVCDCEPWFEGLWRRASARELWRLRCDGRPFA